MPRSTSSRWATFLKLSLAVLALGYGFRGAVEQPADAGAPASLPRFPLDLAAGTLGPLDARLVLAEFGDYSCKFCINFDEGAFASLSRKYVETGKMLFAFYHRPLPGSQSVSFRAATLAECAAENGTFWEVHKAFFSRRGNLSPDSLGPLGRELGLIEPECSRGRLRLAVADQVALGEALRVNSTPTFFLGNRVGREVEIVVRWSGYSNLREIEERIDATLSGR